MEFSVRLLGTVNQSALPGGTVLQRHIAAVTAEQLHSLMTYERVGSRRSDRYRLRPESFIQIDHEIQRGRDTAGGLLQMPAKIDDIAVTLLGATRSAPPTAFLGSLIWNIRPDSNSSVVAIREDTLDGGLPSYKLRINTSHVWLTDSAHRHLGIVEAFRRHAAAPTKFPKFRSDTEFVVEVYRLDRAGEKALFFELNAQQKRITAAKRKEMDVVSSEGYVKDVVRQYDESSRRLFEDNIEVTANQNVNHTLMTMSVFVSSIHEMFQRSELNEAKESAEKRAELAEFYCDFFYKLHDTLKIEIDDPTSVSGKRILTPFYNLFLDIIQPAVNAVEGDVEQNLDKIDAARRVAKELNARVRQQDIANHNATIKALCRIARVIRAMPHWERVVDFLQTGLNVPLEGRFFQKTNDELFRPPSLSTDVQIAKFNDDGSINVQVQNQTIGTLYRYLRSKLKLDVVPELRLVQPDPEEPSLVLGASLDNAVVKKVARRDGGVIAVEAAFFVAGSEAPEDGAVKLGISTDSAIAWKELQLSGQRRLLPESIERDQSYVHPTYDTEISRFVATFSLALGSAPKSVPDRVTLDLVLGSPDLDPNSSHEVTKKLVLVLE